MDLTSQIAGCRRHPFNMGFLLPVGGETAHSQGGDPGCFASMVFAPPA